MRFLILFLLFYLLLALTAGCSSSKKLKRELPVTEDNKPDSTSLVKKDNLTDGELKQLQKILDAIEDVPFSFDSYAIPSQGLEIIKKDVALLNKMLDARGKYIRITIEGHCDERGSDEYNLALGDRRGKTVHDYLVNVGFQEKSLHIISYGEEKPKVDGHTEEAWAANRRVHLVVE